MVKMRKKHNKTVLDNLNSIPVFYIWIFFVIFDLLVYEFMEKELAILFAILMTPIFIHDILLKIFKKRK